MAVLAIDLLPVTAAEAVSNPGEARITRTKAGTQVSLDGGTPVTIPGLVILSGAIGSDVNTISCDLSSLGDGTYFVELEATTDANAKIVTLQVNGVDLASCHSSWTRGVQAVVNDAQFGTTGIISDVDTFAAHDIVMSSGFILVSRTGVRSRYGGTTNSYDTVRGAINCFSGYHTPVAALTAISVVADVANGATFRSGGILKATRLGP